MRRANFVLLTMGSAMLISSGAAMAGLPSGLSFDGYTATNGAITSGCPTGTAGDCTGAITGDGFLQRQVTVGGVKYFQTIVLDKGSNIATSADIANATFANESFVQQGNGSGIGNKSTLNAAGTAPDTTNLGMTTQIFSGATFASDATAGHTDVNVHQSLTDSATLTSIGFDLNRAAGATAPTIALDSTVYLVDNGVTPTTSSPKQVFALRQLTASAAGYLTSDGTNLGADLVSTFGLQPGVPEGAKVDPTGTSTPLAYVSGDTLQLMWLGQSVNGASFGAETLAVNPDTATAGPTTPASEQYSSQASVGVANGTTPETYSPYIWSTLFNGVGSGEPVF